MVCSLAQVFLGFNIHNTHTHLCLFGIFLVEFSVFILIWMTQRNGIWNTDSNRVSCSFKMEFDYIFVCSPFGKSSFYLNSSHWNLLWRKMCVHYSLSLQIAGSIFTTKTKQLIRNTFNIKMDKLEWIQMVQVLDLQIRVLCMCVWERPTTERYFNESILPSIPRSARLQIQTSIPDWFSMVVSLTTYYWHLKAYNFQRVYDIKHIDSLFKDTKNGSQNELKRMFLECN